jgi:hypothetical protein
MKSQNNNQTGKQWDKLSHSQKDEVLLSFKESENEANLIEAGAMFLSYYQKKKITSGLEELVAGKTISNDDLEKEEDKWLKE